MTKTGTADRHADEEPKAGRLNARVVYHAVRRHPLVFVGVLLFAASAAAGVWFFLPLPKKTAAVVFHVASQPQAILAPTAESRIDFTSYKQSQMALLKSRRVLNEALKQPDVRGLALVRKHQADELAWLERALAVDAKAGPEYMRVTLEGDDEAELLALIGAVAKAYQAAAYDRDNSARISRHNELDQNHAKAKADVKKYHDEIDRIALALGSKDATTLGMHDVHRQDLFRTAMRDHAEYKDKLELAGLSVEAARRAAFRGALMAAGGGVTASTAPPGELSEPLSIPPGVVDQELRQDPVGAGLEADAARARQDLAETESLFKPGTRSPAVDKARADLAAAEGKRDKYRADARAGVEARLREQVARVEGSRLAALQADYDRAKLLKDRAWARVLDLQQEIARVNEYKIELDNLKTEIAHKERLIAVMAEEFERVKIELKAPPRVSRAEEPFAVTGIEGNRRLKYALLAALGAFVLGFGGLVGWEHRGRRVTHASEVSADLGARLIGTIPPVAPGGGAMGDRASVVEAIDTARIMMTHGTPEAARFRAILVTSAVAGEGKTTLSGHLAISLTRAGYRTLLVDGDLLAPSAHALFDLPASPGLCELLRGEAEPDAAVRPSPVPGLWVLPAGAWSMATRRALAGDRWRELKQELGAKFDFLVIDTSPLLLVSHTMLLAREADGVVVSVLLGTSQIVRVAETVERLREVGAELIGVVVNNVRSQVYGEYAYRYRYARAIDGEPAPGLAGVAPDGGSER